jgi:hypothetical protein
MNSVDPKDLKKELAELRKDFDKFKGQYHIDGTGRVSLGNQVLTVDRTISMSSLMNRLTELENTVNAMQDLSVAASPNFAGLNVKDAATIKSPTSAAYLHLVSNTTAKSRVGFSGFSSIAGYFAIRDETAGVDRLAIDYSGNVKIVSLAGSGNRPVYADSTGKLYC